MLSRLSSSSLWLIASRVAAQFGVAVFTILLARALGSGGFGEYAFITSVIFIGNILTTFGTDMHLIREIAATGDLRDLSTALTLQLILSAVFIAIIFVASGLIPIEDPTAVVSLRIYSLSLFALAFFTIYTTALRGQQRMLAYSLLNVLLTSLQVLAVFWLYWTRGNLIQLAVALLVVQVVSATLAGVVCGQRVPIRLQLSTAGFARLPALAGASAPIALIGLLGVVYQRSSILLLPGLAGISVAGLFSAGTRLIEAAKTGHVAMLTALYPMMAEGQARDRENWARSFRIPGLILLSGALLGSVLLWLLAEPLVRLLFGSEYLPSVPVVRILAWILAPYAINSFLTLALLARVEERAIVRSLALSTAMLVALTVWWTARAGAPGAAWAALCAEIAQSILLIALSLRRRQAAAAMVV